jgi:hypothetical protein
VSRPYRAVLAVAVASVAVVAPMRPAAADPARPGNVRSFVVSVDPPTPGFTLKVAGGDAFLVLDVDPGHAIEVPGYQGEPYLRVGEDGAVEENLASEALYLNRSRYPAASLPAGVGPNAAPVWRHVGAGGSIAWHDHRVHWMGRGVPPPQGVTTWDVPLTVDGRAVVVHGRYERVAAPSAWPWWLATAVVTALLTLVMVGLVPRRRPAPGALTSPGPRGPPVLKERPPPRLVLAGSVAAGAAILGLPVAWTLATGVGASGLSVWAGVLLLGVAACLGTATAVLAHLADRAADPAEAGRVGVDRADMAADPAGAGRVGVDRADMAADPAGGGRVGVDRADMAADPAGGGRVGIDRLETAAPGRRVDPSAAGAVLAGAGAALLVWSARRLTVWSSSVLVSGVPATWDRTATSVALAVGLSCVATGAVTVLGPVREAPAPVTTTRPSST